DKIVSFQNPTPAEPLSPVETTIVMPSDAPCIQRVLTIPLTTVPRSSSQSPDLSGRTGASLLSTMNWAAASTPAVEFVFAAITKLIVAFLAIAPDHWTSKSDSISSGVIPGSVEPGGMVMVGFLAGSPNILRKLTES